MNNQKKFYFIVTAGIIIFLIIGITQCETKNDITTDISTEETITSTPEATVYEKTDITDDDIEEFDNETEEEPTPKPTAKPAKGTKLFEQIYVPFASREEPSYFESVKSMVEASKFKCKITEPTSNDVGTIKVSAKNGDYVVFCFKPLDDLDVIMIVSYHSKRNKREVSLENYSSDDSSEYDKLSTQKEGKSEKEVSSIKKQRTFLFSNK